MSNVLSIAPDERVVVTIRRHWYVMFGQTMTLLIPFLIPFFIAPLLDNVSFLPAAAIQAYTLFFIAAWYLVLWMIFFSMWTNYYLDVWIVTNKRVINVEQLSLFSREISECRLDRIQDVTAEVHGFLPTVLHFGNVSLETAAESERFFLNGVPNPYDVK
ncbi:MAG TPA: PH domain-containing protein, partial [Candidatus Paceibacterota bacterium]|nr:PH domain-containing protein [Candidatus Paceibacterota bacterium]